MNADHATLSTAGARAALVTGGTSGIGRALALGLARDGYAVTASGRDPERAAALEDEASGEGLNLEVVLADVADEEAVVALVSRHRERRGRLDVLVNSAGVGMGGISVAEMPTPVFDQQYRTNLLGPVIVTREAVDLLRGAGAEHGKALVVNLSSIAATSAPPGSAAYAAYAATKAGVEAFSDVLRLELAGSGVQVTVFVPSVTRSAMVQPMREMGVRDEDMVDPDDLLAAVRFLLSTSDACEVPTIAFRSPRATAVLEAAMRDLPRAPL